MSPTRSLVVERLGKTGLAVGGVFLLAVAAGFALDRGQFFRSYLLGFLFWVGVGVGSLGLAMLNHLTGGLWGLVPRRLHEAAARTLPVMALLFVPVVLGLAMLTFIVWFVASDGGQVVRAFAAATAVVIIACPCADGVSRCRRPSWW